MGVLRKRETRRDLVAMHEVVTASVAEFVVGLELNLAAPRPGPTGDPQRRR